MRLSLVLAAGLLVFSLGGSLALASTPASFTSGETQTEDARKYQAVYSLIMEEEWEEAGQALDEFLSAYPKSPWVDDARFWKCYVLQETGGSRATVFKCFQEFISAYPTSEWADDARRKMIEIAEELAERGKPEYQAIVKAMQKTGDEEVAIAALEALRDVGDESALQSLLDLYAQNAEGKLRSRIINVLGEFESPKALQKLIEIARTDASPELRRRALAAWVKPAKPRRSRSSRTRPSTPSFLRRTALKTWPTSRTRPGRFLQTNPFRRPSSSRAWPSVRRHGSAGR
jgi:hypothetical protein